LYTRGQERIHCSLNAPRAYPLPGHTRRGIPQITHSGSTKRPSVDYHQRRVNMAREIPYPTPGEILLEEFLKPMGITQYRLAKEIGVSQRRINEIAAEEQRRVNSLFFIYPFSISQQTIPGTCFTIWPGIYTEHSENSSFGTEGACQLVTSVSRALFRCAGRRRARHWIK
jgi:hypothetical protein